MNWDYLFLDDFLEAIQKEDTNEQNNMDVGSNSCIVRCWTLVRK